MITAATLVVQGAGPPVQPPAQPRFRSGVESVVLDVSVLDREGRPVRGLAVSDFVVLEDNHPQTVVTFQEVAIPESVPLPAPWMREVVPDVRRNDEATNGRIAVIVMDDASVVPQGLAGLVRENALRMARQVIAGLGPEDLAAVVFTYHNAPAQGFTRDRRLLQRAADTFLSATVSDGIFPWYQHQCTVDTLRRAAELLADLPQRRKAVFFISPGFQLDFGEAAPIPMTYGKPIADTEQQRYLGVELRRAYAEAQRAHVGIHSLDAYGLFVGSAGSDPFKLNRDLLQTLSENTGGRAVVQTNDAAAGIAQAFSDTSHYYLLGYQPTNQRGEGRFRAVTVKANRPGATVRTRTGYFEPERNTAQSGERLTGSAPPLATTIGGLLPITGIPLQVVAAPFAAVGGGDPVVVVVVATEQPAPASPTTETFDLLAVPFTPGGDSRAGVRQTARMALRPSSNPVVRYEIVSRLTLKPGRHSLRVGASRKSDAMTGSVYCDVEVPDFRNDRLSLSGLVLEASPGLASAPKGMLRDILPVVPTTLRDFTRDMTVAAYLRAYQGGTASAQPFQLTGSIINARNEKVWSMPVPLQRAVRAERFAEARFELPVARLEPGRYLLTVEVTDGSRTVRRDLRFTISGP